MRKTFLGIALLLSIIILSACGGIKTKSVNLIDYTEVYFEGVDTNGNAYFDVDIYQAISDVYGWEITEFDQEMSELYDKNVEAAEELQRLFDAYHIDMDKTSGLENGEEVTVTITVDEDYSFAFNDAEEQFTVSGLEELDVLTTEEVENHIIVDFIGANERGTARIENTFNNELSRVNFTVENDGNLSNGESAQLIVNEEGTPLFELGYKLADDFDVSYEVKGLDNYPASANEINNLADIERMIGEEMDSSFESNPSADYQRRYDKKEEVTLYRQFNDEDSYNDTSNGALVKLYTIKEYSDKEAKDNDDPNSEYIYARGFTNIYLDDNGNANVAELSHYNDSNDPSYSIDTIQQIFEGNGYEVVDTSSSDEDAEDEDE